MAIPISLITQGPSRLPRYVNWKKLTTEQKSAFHHEMSQRLNSIEVSYASTCHGSSCCTNDSHKVCLENYYCDIVNAVLAAEAVLPKTNPNSQRSFWTEELTELKHNSIDCDDFWQSIGSPRHGPAFECKKKCQYLYKSALRREKKNNAREKSDSLHSDLTTKNGISFWKTWSDINKTGVSLSSRVDGETEGARIADAFASYFESVYADVFPLFCMKP